MAVSTDKVGMGVELRRGDGAGSEAFTAIAELKSLTPPTFTRDLPEATHTASPNNYKEFIAGLKDGGEVAGDFGFVSDATMTSVLADFEAGTLRNWQIAFPNSKTFAFAGYVQAWGPAQVQLNAPMTANVKIKVNGKVTVS
jgi:predicted secreted protein